MFYLLLWKKKKIKSRFIIPYQSWGSKLSLNVEEVNTKLQTNILFKNFDKEKEKLGVLGLPFLLFLVDLKQRPTNVENLFSM